MKKIKKEIINKINSATISRYNKRLAERGAGPYALGWNKKKFQDKRFFDLLHVIEPEDLNGKTILDIGCGLGDLYEFISKHGYKVKKYIGTDINENFINIAKKKFPKGKFFVADLMTNNKNVPIADTGIALGVINFKQKNHKKYAEEFIKSSFAAVRNVLIINVISDIHNENYPRESFINYYSPAKILAYAQKLTPFCSLIQDYAAEPQYEFMLIMRKKPWKNLK